MREAWRARHGGLETAEAIYCEGGRVCPSCC
jgi:hypothetical protein